MLATSVAASAVARLRKVATSDGPLCKKTSTTMNESRLVASSSEGALEQLHVDTILTPVTFLTKKQRKYIVLTWLAVKERTQFGLRVYAEVFRRQPQLQDFFPSLRGQPRIHDELELEKQTGFRCQASAFADFFDYIVGFVHLDSANFISDASLQIGRRHAERMKSIDSMPSTWWRTFSDSVIFCLKSYFPIGDSVVGRFPILRSVIDRSYRRAWEALLRVIMEKMQQGFREYKNEERKWQEDVGTGQLCMPPIAVTPCADKLKKLAAMAAAVQVKGKKFYVENASTESDEDDLCDSEDTSSNSGSD